MSQDNMLLEINYPSITLEEAKKELAQFYPVWLLTREGIVIGANLMSAWLWEAPQLDRLLGINAGTIFATNFNRIPKRENNEYYSKKTAVMKRLMARFGIEPYLPYIDGLRADQDLWNMYEWGLLLNPDEWESKREWEYPLNIIPTKGENVGKFLRFLVTVSRLTNDAGFLAIYKPHPERDATRSVVEKEYSLLAKVNGTINYIQYLEKKLYEIEQGHLSTIRIRINEEPLSAQSLAAIMSTFTELYTKCWLTWQGRFADLVEYAQTHNIVFANEAHLVIDDIKHTSPFSFDMSINPKTLAEAIKIAYDIVKLEEEVKRRANLENEDLEQDINKKKKELELATTEQNQALKIKIQKDLLEIEEKRLNLQIEATNYEFNRINRALETAQRMVDLLYPGANQETKAIAARSYLDTLLKATDSTQVQLLLLLPQTDETKIIEEGS